MSLYFRAPSPRLIIVVALVSLFAALLGPRPALAQSGSCKSASNAGYTVTVCITSPGSGATVSGLRAVTATTTISGSSSAVADLVFLLDGQYLLTDFEAPYTFTLPTTSFTNGGHTLSVSAVMRDGFATPAASVALTFSNASTPPPGPAFTPVSPAAPPAGQSLIVAAVGDGASGETSAAKVSGMVDAWGPDVFLYLGDVYEKGTYTEFYNWYGTPTVDFGRTRDVTNPAIGNHEYEGGLAEGYFAYWNNPPNHYSYDAGGWHFIALNSTAEYNQTGAGSAQYQWLAADLANNAAACSIAYFHHPVLSVGPQGDTPGLDAMWSLLVQKGVDMVLTGHDHSYQRWAPLDANLRQSSGGVVQFVAGAGGHGVQGAVRSDPRLAVMYGDPASTFGALYFKLNPKGAEYRYVNTAGQILDQGVIPCSGTTDRTAPTAPTGLAVTTSAGGQVQLSWAEAWDDAGVNAYGIYRDGALIGTVNGATTGYADLAAGLNATYSYQVDAVDLGGRRSAKSNTATVTRPAQVTLIFNPTGDTHVRSDFPATNYGRTAALLVDATPDTQSYLRFALEGVNGTVTGAKLRLFAASGSAAGYRVHSLTGAWDEGSVTYGSKPVTGAQVAASGLFSSGAWTETNVSPLVAGNGQLDIAITTTSATAMNLASRETANPPQLVVIVSASAPPPASTATPAPTPTPAPPVPEGANPRVYLPFVLASGG